MGTRFVNVPAADLVAAINRWGQHVRDRGGQFIERRSGRERVFVLCPPKRPKIEVQLYSSLADNAGVVRECGEDAVRLVVGTINSQGEWRNLVPPQKILRTAPKGGDAQRVEMFLGRLHKALNAAYKVAAGGFCCPDCDAPMALRSTGKSKLPESFFYGCIEYPRCRGTRSLAINSTRSLRQGSQATARADRVAPSGATSGHYHAPQSWSDVGEVPDEDILGDDPAHDHDVDDDYDVTDEMSGD